MEEAVERAMQDVECQANSVNRNTVRGFQS
jgi:hypothetical protein